MSDTPHPTPGPVTVMVTNPSGTSSSLSYTYSDFRAATGVSPETGGGQGDTTVTLTGTGFVTGNTSVTISDNVAATVHVTSPTSLRFITPAHATGAVDITVTTPTGTSAPLSGAFTYTPALYSVSYTISGLPNEGANYANADLDYYSGTVQDGTDGESQVLNGTYTFYEQLSTGMTYKITVGASSDEGYTYSLTGGSATGTVGTSNISGIQITCSQ